MVTFKLNHREENNYRNSSNVPMKLKRKSWSVFSSKQQNKLTYERKIRINLLASLLFSRVDICFEDCFFFYIPEDVSSKSVEVYTNCGLKFFICLASDRWWLWCLKYSWVLSKVTHKTAYDDLFLHSL